MIFVKDENPPNFAFLIPHFRQVYLPTPCLVCDIRAIKPTLEKWSPDKLPMKGMQTSPPPLLMSRVTGTLGAQNIGEDTNLHMQGF